MYQNLINSLKKILDSKATQAEKLLKISTIVDFADGLERPQREFVPQPIQPVQPTQTWYETGEKNPIGGGPKVTTSLIDAKKPNSPGALIGVEDVK